MISFIRRFVAFLLAATKNDSPRRSEQRGYQPGIDRGYQPQSDVEPVESADDPRDLSNIKLPRFDTAIQPPRSETPKPTK